jgi:hypothetical protein
MKKIINILFITVCLVSCNEKKNGYSITEMEFKESLKKVKGNDEINAAVFVVIPRAGCSGCISNAEMYMMRCLKDSSSDNDKIFILTAYDSEKVMRARFGELSKNKHVLKDPNNVFVSNKILKSMYPTIYMFDENANLVATSEISPEKNGTADIESFLKSRKN